MREATRAQRIALLVGLMVVAWLALQLFASVLLPFVRPPGDRLFSRPAGDAHLHGRLPARSVAALLLIAALIAAVLLFALLLYPLIVAQVGLLIARVPTMSGRCAASPAR